jgi:hypothetical protein
MSGLAAKRDELHRDLKKSRAHIDRLICAIDHVEGAMRLFEPGGMPTRIMKNVSVHRAQKGSVARLVKDMLREAKGPITAADITEVQIKQRKLKADDATFVMLRKRVGACLTKLKADGVIRVVPLPGLYQGWELVR